LDKWEDVDYNEMETEQQCRWRGDGSGGHHGLQVAFSLQSPAMLIKQGGSAGTQRGHGGAAAGSAATLRAARARCGPAGPRDFFD